MDQRDVNYVQEITNIRSCAVNLQTSLPKLRNIVVALKYRAKETAMRKAKRESLVSVQTIQTLINQLSGHLTDLRDQPESHLEDVAKRSDIAAMILENVGNISNTLQDYVTIIGNVSVVVDDRVPECERRLTEIVAELDREYKKMRPLKQNMLMLHRENSDHEERIR